MHREPEQPLQFAPQLTVLQLVPEPETLDKIEKNVASADEMLQPQAIERGLDVHNQLLKFRMEYPFTGIMPIGNPAKLVKIDNVARRIDIPTGALLVRINAYGGNIIISTGGEAAIPTVAGQDNSTDGFIADPHTLYYVGQKRQLSAIGSAVGVFGSFEFYVQG